MKRCPTCKKTFIDQYLTFCVDDGTPLVNLDPTADEPPADEATVVRSTSGEDASSSGESDSSTGGSASDGPAPAYQPPGSYAPPDYPGHSKRRTWPWIVGVLAVVLVVVAGLGIAAAILVPKMLRAAANRNANQNTNIDRTNNSNGNSNLNDGNSNANSNSANENENSNDDADEEDSAPPTDHDQVLSDLKELEDEWTVANINADKKKLNRILADDYVGVTEGRAQGKAEYLKNIERDTAIQHWEFEDLKVSLQGDRASLSGILRLDVKDQHGQVQELSYRFTDKFVWRGGRWQATASEVDALPVKPGTTV